MGQKYTVDNDGNVIAHGLSILTGATLGYVLTAGVEGAATWQPPQGGSGATGDYLPITGGQITGDLTVDGVLAGNGSGLTGIPGTIPEGSANGAVICWVAGNASWVTEPVPGGFGYTGSVGPTGAVGITGSTGATGLNWQNAWQSGIEYLVNDAVGYGYSSYICVNTHISSTTPDVDTANWEVLASGFSGVFPILIGNGEIGVTAYNDMPTLRMSPSGVLGAEEDLYLIANAGNLYAFATGISGDVGIGTLGEDGQIGIYAQGASGEVGIGAKGDVSIVAGILGGSGSVRLQAEGTNARILIDSTIRTGNTDSINGGAGYNFRYCSDVDISINWDTHDVTDNSTYRRASFVNGILTADEIDT